MKIEIPKDASKLKVSQYIDYKMNNGNRINQVITITGLKREVVLKFTPQQIAEVCDFFDDIIDSIQYQFVTKYKHNGVTYGLVPDINSLTFAEWLDLTAFSEGFPKSIDKMLCVLYRPITQQLNDRYTIEEYDSAIHSKNIKAMREMPITIANGCMLFFSSIRKESERSMLKSLMEQRMEALDKTIQNLETMLKEDNK